MERIIDSGELLEDKEQSSLRPRWFYGYTGQDKARKKLDVFIQAAKLRNEPLDHVLLHGPPGLRKTTLVGIVANEMGVQMEVTSDPVIKRAGDLASILTNLNENDVLFIDEIHRIHRTVEEVLYSTMKDFALGLMVGRGPSTQSTHLDINHFALIGVTTRAGQLSLPLRNRFRVPINLELYSVENLLEVIHRSAKILDVPIDEEGASEIVKRSKRTPRTANRLLERVGDYAQALGKGVITRKKAGKTLKLLEIDNYGLDRLDRRIIETMILQFAGHPVGIDTVAASMGEERVTIEDVYKPYLMQMGFLQKTPRERIPAKRAYDHFNIPFQED